MVRPLHFGVNPETAADNAFQDPSGEADGAAALREFDAMVDELTAARVTVHVFNQERADTPDAVFPNNWFSTHEGGEIVTYPMFASSRRRERRDDVIGFLRDRYAVRTVIDLTMHEEHGTYLEGTGAIVFDHVTGTAFMARSQRSDEGLLDALCQRLKAAPFPFTARDRSRAPIYHTNVLLSIGAEVALFCPDAIPDESERSVIAETLALNGRLVLELTFDQLEAFAGNALEIDGADGPVLVMSARARRSLSERQLAELNERIAVIAPSIPTIEKSGGSARCMMAGIHLPQPDEV